MKPKIFIASPLFNPPQIEIIQRIETLLTENGYDFYSARLHSGSDKMTPEERKDINAWDPVFDSNEKGLDETRVMIAVLEYAMMEDRQMGLATDVQQGDGWCEVSSFTSIELPDAGTVWECGYHRAQNKLVLGFHTDKAKHLNLMLSHGCDGLIRGWDNLGGFLSGDATKLPDRLMNRANNFRSTNPHILEDAKGFDWSFAEPWDAKTKEVE